MSPTPGTERSGRACVGLLSVLLVGACSGGARTTPTRNLSQFECNDRHVAYTVVGGFAADEAGITMDCGGNDPQITRWRLEDGERKAKKNPLTADQFDGVWAKIDATGWRQLPERCENPAAEGGDPAYMIDVADHAFSTMLNCDGKTLPFPYDRIINELDLRAAGFGEQDQGVR